MKGKVIHIAGSKGKGTTAHLLAKLLEWKGKRVGLFTSPYIASPTEQIQINGVAISEEDLKRGMAQWPELSEFEALTLAAFDYFADCDYVVLECGWGGKRDASNWVDSKDLTILTHVELEHTEVLGKDLESITREKLGITRPDVPLITSPNQDPAVMETISAQDIEPALAPSIEVAHHHPESVGMAVMAMELLGFTVDAEDYKDLEEVHIPGRFELHEVGPHLLILDGAHTYDSIHFVQEEVRKLSQDLNRDVYWGVHFLSDKRPDLWTFFPEHSTFWIPLDDPRAGSAPDDLNKKTIQEFKDSMDQKNGPSIFVIVGSFKLVAAARALLPQ